MADTIELAKVYRPRDVEGTIYAKWEQAGCFAPQPDHRPREERYTIVIPPPNVTGALHLGHALNNTLQDILIRWHRMMQHNTLWLPGCDHAGIATQAVVEKRLFESESKTRHDVGRDALVERIWAWKDQYESRILNQLKIIGCSCDWNRKRFTLDDGLARAVRHTFFKMFRDGLIFRGKRLVNWDTQLQTAVADDEVYHETVKGHFWHFRYPVNNPQPGEPDHVVIATTRPETMLGDTAVAVHPDPVTALEKKESDLRDRIAAAAAKEKPGLEAQFERLEERRTTHLPMLIQLRDMAAAGCTMTLPLVDREIPLITDPHADPLLGTGCVKITPAHDHNDYEVGLRAGVPMLNMMSADGTVNENGGPYQGLKMGEARKRVVADMEARDLVDHVEDKDIDLGHSDRSKSPVEPYLSDQWFLNMAALADPALEAVSGGRVKFFPERYAKTYLDWLGEKRDWCISRQLWWGHRIPVWSKTVTLTEANWTDELLSTGLDHVIFDDAWKDVAVCRVERVSDSETVDPKAELNPVVAETEGAYRILICLREEDENLVGVLESAGLVRDPDVLDTWFSSALWPHSTLGWPDETNDLKYYYPTSVLVTSRDIITLWVVRMVVTGLYNMGEVPFDHVYIHTKILDGRGETMSKSKGNGVDPLDCVEIYGADALRYSIADLATETQDVRMPVDYVCPHCEQLTPQAGIVPGGKQPSDVRKATCKHCKAKFATQWADDALKAELNVARETSEKFEIGRNFCNKLWNSARFAFMNLEGTPCEPIDLDALHIEDRWILSELSMAIQETHRALSVYQYSTAVKIIRDFFWDGFCDWYIELTKPRFRDPELAGVTQQIFAFVLDQTLRLLSPFLPFITERLWEELNRLVPQRGLPGLAEVTPHEVLMLAEYPPTKGWPNLEDENSVVFFRLGQAAVRGIREVRNQCNVPPKQRTKITVRTTNEEIERIRSGHSKFLDEQRRIMRGLAGASEAVEWVTDLQRPKNSGTCVVGPWQIFIHDISDDAAERKRLEVELANLDKRIAGAENKLANPKFVNNAKPEVVAAERDRLAEMQTSRAAAQASLADLAAD